MLVRYIVVINLIAAFILSSCQNSNQLSQSEIETVRTEVRQMLSNYFTDIEENGLLAEFKYLDNSEDFFWVPPGYSSAISYDSVSTVIKQTAPRFRSIKYKWNTFRIDPLSTNYASFTGTISSTLIDTTGQVMEVSLIETGLVIRRKNGWKLLSGQSANLPQTDK